MPKGKVYLNSIRDFYKVKCEYRFEVTRYPKLEKYPQVSQLQELAPSKRLLYFFKSKTILSEDTLYSYYFQYKQEMTNSIDSQKALKYLKSLLDDGHDIQLICFCSDYRYCHRTILGKWFETLGYEVNFS